MDAGGDKRPRRGVVVCDLTAGTISVLDPPLAELLGYTVDELAGQPFSVLLQSDPAVELAGSTQTLRDSGYARFLMTTRRKDGTSCHVRVAVVGVRDAQGKLTSCAAAVEEVREAPDGVVREPRRAYEASRAPAYRLTEREIEVLRQVAAGKTDKEIAKTLGRSPYTIHNHVRHILLKMGASSRTDATVRALREGLV